MASVFIREKLLSDGRASLILDYRQNGQRKKETLRIYVNPQDKKSRSSILRNAYAEAYRSAEYLRSQLEGRLIINEHDLPIAYDKSASFLDYFKGLAVGRNYNWQSVAAHLYRYTKGQLSFGNVTEEWLGSFQDYLCTCIKPVTVCSYIGIITTALNRAVREKLIPANPSNNIRKIRGKEEPLKYLTQEQIELLLQNRDGIPEWFVQAFLFSCSTGLRISDVETLVWANIHRANPNKEAQVKCTIVKEQVKTQNLVRVPLTSKALAIIEALQKQLISPPNSQERVFKLKSRSQMKRYIIRWRKQAGVYFTYHSSRHTFGTNLQSAGVDIYTTSALMGHSNVQITTKYAKVIDPTRDKAIEKLSNYQG
jgi:integrase